MKTEWVCKLDSRLKRMLRIVVAFNSIKTLWRPPLFIYLSLASVFFWFLMCLWSWENDVHVYFSISAHHYRIVNNNKSNHVIVLTPHFHASIWDQKQCAPNHKIMFWLQLVSRSTQSESKLKQQIISCKWMQIILLWSGWILWLCLSSDDAQHKSLIFTIHFLFY